MAAVKILVVDDEPDLELLITQKFRKKIGSKEFDFLFTRNGVEALQKLEENKDIEIILTDINMPEMDGLTLLAHLPELNRIYKAVVISAYGDMSNIRSAMNKGAADFITKPIDFQDLEITINKIIEQCRTAKEGLAAKDNLNDIHKELDIARKIQQAMIPQNFNLFESNPHIEILGLMMPAKEVGGDFFDFFAIDDSHIGFIIADVSGKSISASLFMAVSKTIFRSVANTCKSPEEALAKANNLISCDNPSCMFVTAFYGILDTNSGEFTYSNAGHNPPFIISQDNTLILLGKSQNVPLGIDDMILEHPTAYTKQTVNLKDSDCIFLYTDGVTEAMNRKHELYTTAKLESALKKCGDKTLPDLIKSIISDIKTFTEGFDQSDDIAILCIRYYEKEGARKFQDKSINAEAALELQKI